ncbi:MAG TPA: hypothetical protein VFU47_05305, partial [Armatimonadota bacterium]|nr:hypothetical protein [Armatimonadota bacterium]
MIAAALLALAPISARAQESGADGLPETNAPRGKKKPPPVAMEVQVGLKSGEDSYARPDQTVPVRVVLDNNEKAVKGRLEVRDFRGRVTRMPVDLPRKAHQEYTLYVPLRTDPDREDAAAAEVVLLTGGKQLNAKPLRIKDPQGATLVLSATGDDS